MKTKAEKLESYTDELAALLEKRQGNWTKRLTELLTNVRTLVKERPDVRLSLIGKELMDLREEIAKFSADELHECLIKIVREAKELKQRRADDRLAAILDSLIESSPQTLSSFGELLLERILEWGSYFFKNA
jgi:hypothetical protein